jgi:hypothetical protein
MKKLFILTLLYIIFLNVNLYPQSAKFKIARLKYSGGGDWYNDPSAEVNMMNYLKKNTTIDVDEPKFYTADVASDEIFDYPILLLTGHGNIDFSDNEIKRLRKYVENGGFIYADDDYGMDESFRREIKKLFPNEEMKELPFNHKIYNIHYNFSKGLPKIHELNRRRVSDFGTREDCASIILMKPIFPTAGLIRGNTMTRRRNAMNHSAWEQIL